MTVRIAIRNVGYNLGGYLFPMVVALLALPTVSRYAGTARLGFLGLAWSLIGYFALLDLGLSRIVTRRIALAELEGRMASENRIVRRLCVRLFVAVAAISSLLAIFVPARLIVGASASAELVAEAGAALPILFLCIPATVVTGLLRGALEGLQRFGRVNVLRSVFGAASFGAPLVVLPFRHDLVALIGSIAVVRIVALAAHAWWALAALTDASRPAESEVQTTSPPTVGSMIREGGWLTVSNVVGPLMVTFDRFVIAAFVSLTATSYYFVPQEMALRLLVFPAAVATAIFPMMARLREGGGDRSRISRGALLSIAASSLPACALLAALAGPLLTIWMGTTFASGARQVAAIIAVGLFGNCCAQAPFAWIQAAGRSDVTGKLHLLELPFYLVILLVLTWRFGIVGAALAWSLRTLADCGLLFRASSRLFPDVDLSSVLVPIAAGVAALAVLGAGTALPDGVLRTALLVAASGGCIALAATMAWRLREATAPQRDPVGSTR